MIGLCGLILFAWLLRVHLAAQEESNALIHEQRELLQATLSSIGDAVIATDVDGHVTFLNEVAQALTGWSQDDAIRKPLSDVFHIVNEETRQDVESPALRALREDKIVGLANHTVVISKVGPEWPIDDSAAPIRTLDGKLSGAILVFREITERKRHEDELRESLDALREANQHKDELMSELKDTDRRKDEFLAMLAHELRNPLSPISNALQVWPLVENDPEELNRLRSMMERQIRQLIRLIDDLMDVSRISRGRIQLQKQRVDLRTVISEAIESVQPLIDTESHRVTVALPAEPLFVEGDVARLTQVFGNVLHNAVKYAGRNGVIWIAAERRDGHAAVSIRDNGPGIPTHMLSQIFEMFQQVDKTSDRSFGGLGIGLSLVKQLVELHGGTVEARSEGPGSGSEFIVTLPAAANGQSESITRHTLQQVTSLPRHRILVVDDVGASAKTLAMMLNGIGQDVAIANDGQSAIARALESKPDVVFLDIAMPGMDGYEVARRLRAHEELKGLVLVALTGYGQEEDRKKAVEAGFDHHMVKPTSMEALRQLLTTAAISNEPGSD
jgi:PAS domain S-box-containing protein